MSDLHVTKHANERYASRVLVRRSLAFEQPDDIVLLVRVPVRRGSVERR